MLRRAVLATRPAFLTASVLPVLVGTAWAAHSRGRFDGFLFTLALAATVLAHAAANVYNDVGDDQIGADTGNTGRMYPYTGGSRFIQTGLISRTHMARLALILAAASACLGGVLTTLRGPGILAFGAAGLALGFLYSLPGVQLSARGAGEAAVAIGLGALPVLGAAWLQSGSIDWRVILVALPVSCWVAAILVINEVPDMEADRRAGKHTLVVRWGARGARAIYVALTLGALGSSGIGILRHVLPAWYLIPAIGLAALGVWAAQGIATSAGARPRLRKSIELTLGLHALGCVTLIAAVLLTQVG
jgi:1,4-dihydroxy-2-naphthoate octaprenyltransferase